MTSLPAQKFRLQDRGLLRPGMSADIVVFDENSVGDASTFSHPHAYSVGFHYVLVNGQLAIENQKLTPTRSGTVLHGPGYVRSAQ
ncbi:MAG TPA: amidohydrolase family protein, partial [Chryseolinea sp.]|nr:amidohydrolase family protein [Chryseolinea sp.]